MAVEIIEVSSNVICIRRLSYFTCSYMVRREGKIVMVDAGMKSDGADVMAGLHFWKASPADIQAILLTHWHNDHSAGAKCAQHLSHAPVYYHPAEIPYFTGLSGAKGLRAWISDLIPELGVLVLFKGLLGEAAPHPIQATHLVKDGDTIVDDFIAIETPGHTSGHISYYYKPGKILFAGDALAVIGEKIRFMARPVTLDLTDARASMQKCMSLDLAAICPGHREPLLTNIDTERRRMQSLLEEPHWPLLG